MKENKQRIHSLDALRGIMMILGIVLHSSETYNIGSEGLWLKDPNAGHIFFNYLSEIIHIFRMPVFFVIGGFFGAMLFYNKGPRFMITHRVKRIVIPFIVFLFLLHPLIYMAMSYTSQVFGVSSTAERNTFSFFPHITYHLWFLYYFILITLLAFFIAKMLGRLKGFNGKILSAFKWLMEHRIVLFSSLTVVIFLLLVWIWNYWAPTPVSLKPNIKVTIFYSLFYFFGWLLFVTDGYISKLKNNSNIFITLSITVFTLKFIFKDEVGDILYGFLNAAIGPLFVVGIIGWFLKKYETKSDFMRYISDASYWVYLIHLPITIIIPGLLGDLGLSPFIKFTIVMVITGIVCFSGYHLLVRSTFIGVFLNGRKYGKAKSA